MLPSLRSLCLTGTLSSPTRVLGAHMALWRAKHPSSETRAAYSREMSEMSLGPGPGQGEQPVLLLVTEDTCEACEF